MQRESSVLLFGVMDTVGVAIGAELRAAGRRVLIGTTAIGASDASRGVGQEGPADDTILRGDLTTVAGGREIARRAWQLAESIESLVLHLGGGGGVSPRQGMQHGDWEVRASSVLKVPFFVARDFALRVREAGGTVILVVDARRYQGSDAMPARVFSAGLTTMAQGLAKAVPDSVKVSSVILSGEATGKPVNTAEDVARAVRFLLVEGPQGSGTMIQLGVA